MGACASSTVRISTGGDKERSKMKATSGTVPLSSSSSPPFLSSSPPCFPHSSQSHTVLASSFPSCSPNNNNNNNNNKNNSGGGGCKKKSEGVSVVLHVYNLLPPGLGSQAVNKWLGLGVYHSGIEVFGLEWSFAGNPEGAWDASGIFPARPKRALPQQALKESIVLGYLPPGTAPSRIDDILRSMAPLWKASGYHLLQRNCNHFSCAFRDAIAKEFPEVHFEKIPSYVNRTARVVDILVPCLLYRPLNGPKTPSQRTPPTDGSLPGSSANAHPSRSHFYQTSEKDNATSIPIPTSREAMRSMTVRELKTMMWVNGISWDGCIEKEDLIRGVEAHQERHREL